MNNRQTAKMRRSLAEKVIRSPGAKPRSAGPTRGVFPRYVSIGNAKKVTRTTELVPGRVYADWCGAELVGVEIVG